MPSWSINLGGEIGLTANVVECDRPSIGISEPTRLGGGANRTAGIRSYHISSRTSVSRPVIAAAAAIAGVSRCVRPL